MVDGSGLLTSAQPSVAWLLGGHGLPTSVDPTQAALVWDGGERTYAELRAHALALGSALRAAGLEDGDRVVTHLFNRGEVFELYFACAFAGLTMVPASFRATATELADILDQVGARYVFTEEELADTMHQALGLASCSAPLVVLDAAQSGAAYESLLEAPPLPEARGPVEPHIVLFSSGTTGKPKGAMVSHGGLMHYSMQQVLIYPEFDRRMRMLVVPTLFNTGGLHDFTLPTFLAGGTVYILPSRGWDPRRMSEYIDRWQITHTIIFPTMFPTMLHADDEAALPLASLRVVLTGGEVCPPEVMRRVRDRWPHWELIIGYGSTEAGAISIIGNDEMDRKPGSVGRAASGQLLRILRDDGTPAATGETGEVWTASPMVTMGYWGAPELTAASLNEGWLRTGDLGRVDEEGYLYLDGRTKDMIISKGQNIYPAEIEATLLEHPDIDHCAVVGIPDPDAGEAVVAVVVRRRGTSLSADEIVAFSRERIASYKKPRHVLFRDSLPISVNNKVLKGELAADISVELGRSGGRVTG